MSFEQLLATYIGRTIEVFLGEEFYTGVLVSVGNGVFVVNISDTYQPQTATLQLASVVYIRVLV
ncbi:hypothetical protein [Paenibacillus gansuensis]|uniref:DUF2642 domain-containing protein n=1 Tax=Paenibacillus gansuensis TaxID=306542 RepID=A0ABW5PBX0_9BACL